MKFSKGHKNHYETLLIILHTGFFFFCGIAAWNIHQPDSKHLIHQSEARKFNSYSCVITGTPQAISGYKRMKVEIQHLYTESETIFVKGTCLLWIEGSRLALLPGDQLFIRGTPSVIPNPDIPGDFNFKTFYANQNIFHQHFIAPDDLIRPSAGNFSLQRIACQANKKAQAILDKSINDDESLQIASALLLGNRWHVEKDIKKMYADSGLMHILAISGLHVGILYGILIYLFKPFVRSAKSRAVTLTFILLFLWAYAFITGLSVSVIRATLLFTLFGIQTLLDKKARGSWNLLAFAAFILLIYNPYYIYSIGFQFSFLAVGGILYFHPRLRNLLNLTGLGRKTWELTSVSLAAQLTLLPLSLYYFHQFPTWFLPANLLIVPFLGIILYLGLATLFLAPLPLAGTVSAFLFEKGIWIINRITATIQELPLTTLGPFYPTQADVLFTYLTTISLLIAFRTRQFKWIYAAGIIIFLMTGGNILALYLKEKQQNLIVLNTQPVCWMITDGYSACLAADNMVSSQKQMLQKQLKPYFTQHNIAYVHWENLAAPYFLRGKPGEGLRLYRHKTLSFGIAETKYPRKTSSSVTPNTLFLKNPSAQLSSSFQKPDKLITQKPCLSHLKNLHCLFTDGYLILTL